MKITWKLNPLESVVELNEHEKQILWHRIKIEAILDHGTAAEVHLRDGTAADAIKVLDLAYLYNDEPRDGKLFDDAVSASMQWYLNALAGVHDGDCICVACSCAKCRAEELMGCSTIDGLGKHAARKIWGAFATMDPNEAVTIDIALERLRLYEPTKGPSWDGITDAEFQKHIPRWRDEAREAHAWLVNYVKRFGYSWLLDGDAAAAEPKE